MATEHIQSLERALTILESFTYDNSELSIREISLKVGLPAPTVCRFLHTFVKTGYLVQNPQNKKYRVGHKVLHFAAAAYKEINLRRIAADVTRKVRDAIGETAYLDIVENNERVCLFSIPGRQVLSLTVPEGQRSPLYAGADSRMLLGSFAEEASTRYIDNTQLKKFASNTILSKQDLCEVVQQSWEANLSMSVNEFRQGSACVSVPIRDYTQGIIAVLSVAFSAQKAVSNTLVRYTEVIQEAAQAVSESLGYQKKPGSKEQNYVKNCEHMEELLKKVYQKKDFTADTAPYFNRN